MSESETTPVPDVDDVAQDRTPPTSEQHRRHRAAQLEDRLNGVLSGWLSRRGWQPRVEPYTSYGSAGWVRVMARALLAAPDTDAAASIEDDTPRAVRGWRSFVTAQVPGAVVEVVVGGRTHEVTADRGGYVDAVLTSDLPPGWHEVTLRVADHEVTAPVVVVDAAHTTAMVSDIDDTVMVTALPRPLLAAWNSMVLHESARRVVPGMADLYRRWHAANPGSPTFYLSTGAWNVAPALRRFLRRAGYPAGPLLLTDWGPTNTGWFRSGQQHKVEQLRRLMTELPQVRWTLVGDDGQHDPAIYGQIASEFPDRVRLIAIRELTVAEQVLAHGTPAPSEEKARTDGGPVVRGADGNALALRLIDEGLLPPGRP